MNPPFLKVKADEFYNYRQKLSYKFVLIFLTIKIELFRQIKSDVFNKDEAIKGLLFSDC